MVILADISAGNHDAESGAEMYDDACKTARVDLRWYDDACKTDPELRKIDGVFQDSTRHVINALTNGSLPEHSLPLKPSVPNGVQEHSVPLKPSVTNGLKEAMNAQCEIDEQVANAILGLDNDKLDPEFSEIVQLYFENNLKTLNFYNSLENWLRKAKDDQLIIEIALQHLSAEGRPREEKCQKVLEKLQEFKSAGNPFQNLQSLYKLHGDMLNTIETLRSKLEKKLWGNKLWGRALNVIFGATFAAVAIGTNVAAIIAGSPLADALAKAAANTVDIGNSMWKKLEDILKDQVEVIDAMQAETRVAITDMESINVLVDRLKGIISSMEEDPDIGQVVMDDIKEKQKSVLKEIEYLLKQVEEYREKVVEARNSVSKKISRLARR